MKLNYKRTILVGFAFFLISAFWQAYDATIPVILTNKFGMSQTWSGVIMALDNILAVFMLPVFGALSDKCSTRWGKRTPFITFGTVLAAVALLCLSFVDGAQLRNISDVAVIDDPAALEAIYDAQADRALMTPEGDTVVLSEKFTKEEFSAITCKIEVVDVPSIRKGMTMFICVGDGGSFYPYQSVAQEEFEARFEGVDSSVREIHRFYYESGVPVTILGTNDYVLVRNLSPEQLEKIAELLGTEDFTKTVTNPYYTNYVVPARQAFAAARTAENSLPLILFILLLLVILLAMATFRSPAVALMPDVTMKPLRSKANAIINLMGTAGGILVLVLGMVFATSAVQNAMMNYTVYYGVIAAIMLTALMIFLTTVKEPKWAAEMAADSVQYGIEEAQQEEGEKRSLSAAEKRSLLLILASIALWYFGYNAVTSKYAVYAGNILDKDYNTTMLIAQGAAIVAYLPAGTVASKIGRKKTILAGVVMLTTAFGCAAFMRSESPTWLMNVMFALAGIAWATINVNSFPMVVEMCSGADIGKYTGFYYTASMSAQIATPMLSGLLMDKMGMTVLFPYAAIFVALAFLTMFLVKHGDAKITPKKGLEALDIED